MSKQKHSIRDSYYPQRLTFGNTLLGNDEVYFSEKIIIMHTDAEMLRHTIGDGTPYRLHNMRIGLYTKGSADNLINLEQRHVEKGILEFFGAGTLFQMNDVSADLQAIEVIFSSTYLCELLGGDIPPLFTLNAASQSIEIDEDEQQHFQEMMRLLLFLCKSEGEQSPVSRSMAITLLRYTISLFQKYLKRDNRSFSRQEAIFHEFARLVTLSHGRQRRHKYYADKLNISEHYLSIAVKQSSGIPAKEWIDRMVMTEIKQQLVHTDLNITQIAAQLDFPSDSFLSKFFRRHTGMSPMEFRKAYKE